MTQRQSDDSADTPIAVTGATGRLGGRVARLLAAAGMPQTMVVRDPARAPRLPGATTAQATFGDHSAVRAALDGIDRVLMVSASETLDRVEQHRTFVDAAAEAGVRHLVYISFFGAAPDATFTLARDHWATEQHIRSSGMNFTFLRDNLYADFAPALVGDDDVIRGPAGDGRASVVAQDDIAEAAVTVLTHAPEHAGVTYDLTGPQSLTFEEIATILSEATGRAITYHPESVPEAYRSRASYGAPDWQLDAWVSTYTAVANGELDGVTEDVPRLTGHPATALRTLLFR
ncbi:SDR family oxidoreductase [Actinobacteria bacterium YIM 96077]|uniref:SDR family NAD(P)-dependent oxidoreductase n=1 Tax=Phytoactinopolyspora halophila TaxID=1981511 RepID=A0A329QTD2_9ACTN|nr:SDR family oxidoreductase [Phytoactinopolyspora halophila]AYY13793.1 SDR family oxidoreductase [Actinobacteria bacterium YIM 96077]RAW15664.1 SDR family NAD(P)-dependent oxidoreductase [Phytoactinopolyspora halophila]